MEEWRGGGLIYYHEGHTPLLIVNKHNLTLAFWRTIFIGPTLADKAMGLRPERPVNYWPQEPIMSLSLG